MSPLFTSRRQKSQSGTGSGAGGGTGVAALEELDPGAAAHALEEPDSRSVAASGAVAQALDELCAEL
jgi:hypothetical protein